MDRNKVRLAWFVMFLICAIGAIWSAQGDLGGWVAAIAVCGLALDYHADKAREEERRGHKAL